MTHRDTFSANDTLDLLDAPSETPLLLTNPLPSEENSPQPTTCVLVHPTLGIFIGMSAGMAFWSNMAAAGMEDAYLFDSADIAQTVLANNPITGPYDPEATEVFFTRNAHWTHLDRMGLPVGDMVFAAAERRYPDTLRTKH